MQSNTAVGGIRTAGKLAEQLNLILKNKQEDFRKDNKIFINFKPITENFDELLKLAPDVFRSMEYRPISKNTEVKDINLTGFKDGKSKDLFNNKNKNEIETISVKIAKNKIYSQIKDVMADIKILDFFSSVKVSYKEGTKTVNKNLKDYLVKNEQNIKLRDGTKTISQEDCFTKMEQITTMGIYAKFYK